LITTWHRGAIARHRHSNLLFDFDHERVLSWLLKWFGDGLDLGLKKASFSEGPDHLAKQDL
jgi:hypothetical protein